MVKHYAALPKAFRDAAGEDGQPHWLEITGNARRKTRRKMSNISSNDAIAMAAAAREFLAIPKASVRSPYPRAEPQYVPPAMSHPGTLLARAAAHSGGVVGECAAATTLNEVATSATNRHVAESEEVHWLIALHRGEPELADMPHITKGKAIIPAVAVLAGVLLYAMRDRPKAGHHDVGVL